MILGIFGGRTPKSFERAIASLNVAQSAASERFELRRKGIDNSLDQAMADRSAAIYALSQELRELGDHKASL